MNGMVVGIYICPVAGGLMQQILQVEAIKGKGLLGDRYGAGTGSWSFKPKTWLQKYYKNTRQVTLISAEAFEGTGFRHNECRRNLIVKGLSPQELLELIDHDFQVGGAFMRGVKDCLPCPRPTKLSKRETNFEEEFKGKGGLVAQVIASGLIREKDAIIPSL